MAQNYFFSEKNRKGVSILTPFNIFRQGRKQIPIHPGYTRYRRIAMTKDWGDRIFDVRAEVNGEEQQIQIKLTETTDGVPYYICLRDNQEISQIREEDGKWKQLWGSLNNTEIQVIGEAIAQRSL